MQLKAKQDFTWAHRGIEVEQFVAGQVFEASDSELVTVAVREGWAEEVKAHKGAPENKAEAPAPKAKKKA
jgi:hypothetical protein